MRLPGQATLQRITDRVRARLAGGALILLYHHVADLPTDPERLGVSPRHFAEHLEVVRRQGRPVRLQELVRRGGPPPPRAVAVTFDDGYRDNLLAARPLLERHDVPATVFVTAGYLGRGREFWSDELERALLGPGPLPATLDLLIDGRRHRWTLGEAAGGGAGPETARSGPRHRLYRSLHRLLRPLPDEAREPMMDALLAWAGAAPEVRESRRMLDEGEVARLAEGGLVEVGAHTLTHPVLAAVGAGRQEAEIRGSKARLEAILGRPVTSFAYPYGYRTDYTGRTVGLVKRAAFACACAAFPGLVWAATDPFQLPRLAVPDGDGEALARQLHRWWRGR